jgi:heptosyltransferase-3
MDRGKRFERWLKRLVFGLLAGRARRNLIAPEAVDFASCRRILLVRVNYRLGNLLLVTPAIDSVRRAMPEAEIDFLGGDGGGDLLHAHPGIRRVLAASREVLKRPRSFLALVRDLRARRYDLVIDCARGASFLGAALAGMSGGRYRVAQEGSRYQRLFNVLVPRAATSRHKVDLLLGFLGALGLPIEGARLRMPLGDEERRWAAEQWTAWGFGDGVPVVGVNLGGRGLKRWPRERFLEVAARIQRELGIRVVVFVGPEEEEELTRIRSALPADTVVAPPVSSRRFAALLARCRLVVTADTGPMHLSAAIGVPTITVFVAVSGRFYEPLGPMHVALRDPAGVSVDAVLDAVQRRLEAPTSAEPSAVA